MKCFRNLVLLGVFFLQGCVTPYQKAGFGGGYSEIALSKDIYIVGFSGNGFTSSDLVDVYMLRRGAQLALEKGYKYFLLLKTQRDVKSQTIDTPTTIDTTGYGTSYYHGNAYDNSLYLSGTHNFNASTTINPGHSYQINKFRSKMIIKMLNNNKQFPNALDARIILSNFNQQQ